MKPVEDPAVDRFEDSSVRDAFGETCSSDPPVRSSALGVEMGGR